MYSTIYKMVHKSSDKILNTKLLMTFFIHHLIFSIKFRKFCPLKSSISLKKNLFYVKFS